MKGKRSPKLADVSPQLQEDPLSFFFPIWTEFHLGGKAHPTQHSNTDILTKGWKDNEDPSSSRSLTITGQETEQTQL